MLAAGVATTASTGRLIDRFRDRAVFPIRHDGVILGFVGRRHPDRTDHDKAGPKYLNTGDTPLFHKGDQLYTTGPLGPDVTPVIVEGPMDAIAVTLATSGKYLGVAPLGTSLTDEQAAQLRQLGSSDADRRHRRRPRRPRRRRTRLLDPHPLRPRPPLRRPARRHRPRRPPRHRTGRRSDFSARQRGATRSPTDRRTLRPPPRSGRRPRRPPRHRRPTPRALGERTAGHLGPAGDPRRRTPHHPRRPRHRVERGPARPRSVRSPPTSATSRTRLVGDKTGHRALPERGGDGEHRPQPEPGRTSGSLDAQLLSRSATAGDSATSVDV